jgi:ATP-dependent DNA ligase
VPVSTNAIWCVRGNSEDGKLLVIVHPVHWVRPKVVVEVTYLTWTEGGLLPAVSYQGRREDKPARQVVRSVPRFS